MGDLALTASRMNSDAVVALTECERKAYLLMFRPGDAEPKRYLAVVSEQLQESRRAYANVLRSQRTEIHPFSWDSLDGRPRILTDASLVCGHLEAYADSVEIRHVGGSDKVECVPHLIVPTHKVSNEQKLRLSFAGYVLSLLKKPVCGTGVIIGADSRAHRVGMAGFRSEIEGAVECLNEWRTSSATIEPPPVALGPSCPTCPFEAACRKVAVEADDLSLLRGLTQRQIRDYRKKGIFTVNQLSYQFKPRRQRKRRGARPVRFRPELRALAIREHKVYVDRLPQLSRVDSELFLDIEGIPDQKFQYLIGIVAVDGRDAQSFSFWADDVNGEQKLWAHFISIARRYPEAPIYHYGQYDLRAIRSMGKRCNAEAEDIERRMVNVNSLIYGQLYFPVYGNRLKELGSYVGAVRSSPVASGLDSLAWRYLWERTHLDEYKDALVQYNREDCRTLIALTDRITDIVNKAGTMGDVDFADDPKCPMTSTGEAVCREFEQILLSAHLGYDGRKITFSGKRDLQSPPVRRRKRSVSLPPKPDRTIVVPRRRKCPKCGSPDIDVTDRFGSTITIVDLVFTRNGVRRQVTAYTGRKIRCRKCMQFYNPAVLRKLSKRKYGHRLISWCVYQRVVLRLPYLGVARTVKELFGVSLPAATILGFIAQLSGYYAHTKRMLLSRLRKSPFIHVDETKINVHGVDQFVWVFTDGRRVVFERTKTREATIVHEILAGYEGTLVSDFYPGYDSVPCKQQKCWAHLIRDLNEDLWKESGDSELEQFVVKVKELFVPIMEDVQRYGLKRRHLAKHGRAVRRFYKSTVDGRDYNSEVAANYQKRFQRYRESLFRFTTEDGIPWNNNMAERAIRHLAVQRKISGSFGEGFIDSYLLLLGVAQTCRFQEKSFLHFLLSGRKDVDAYRETRKRTSVPGLI